MRTRPNASATQPLSRAQPGTEKFRDAGVQPAYSIEERLELHRTGKRFRIFVNHPSPYLTNCEPHGDGLLAYQYIDGLARRGHQLYVAAPIVKLREPLHRNVHLSIIKTTTRPSWESPSRRHRIEYAFRVRRLFKRYQAEMRFDIIHQLNPATTWVNLFLPTGNLPFVVRPVPPPWSGPKSESGLSVTGFLRSALKRLIEWEMFSKATCILIPVPSGRAAVPAFAAIRSRIQQLHYGIDTKEFAPAEDGPAATRFDPHVLFLANLHERKGIYILLKAFEYVVKQVPEARLTIAGDGPERVRLERMLGEMSTPNHISMPGGIARENVASVLRSCSVYCLPSYGEPFGMSTLGGARSHGLRQTRCRDRCGRSRLSSGRAGRRESPGRRSREAGRRAHRAPEGSSTLQRNGRT